MEEQTVNNQVQQPNISTPQEPKHSSFLTSKLFLITLIVAVLFTIIYAGIYLYLGSQLDQISKSSPIPLPLETSVKKEDPTANWKTYINPTMQFSIKSPSDFEFFPEKPPGGGAVPSLDGLLSSTLLKRKAVEKVDTWLNINVKSWNALVPELLGKGITFEKWVKDEISIHDLGYSGVIKTSYVIGNIPATRISYTDQSSHQRTIIMYVQTATRMYEISVSIDLDREKEYARLSDQILSAFKFTDRKDQVVCTQDARQCPDGSYVSRQPPSCEFSKCP